MKTQIKKSSSDYVVDMRGISKQFPGILANDKVTLQVKQGEIHAILGENGAGKSTLMSLLFGLYEPDAGEIYIRGKKSTIKNPNYCLLYTSPSPRDA